MSSTNNNDDDDGDGVMMRLAKRLFASPNSPLTEFADRQRIERIEKCRELERILKACQAANKARNAGNELDTNAPSPDEDDYEATRSSTRIARFFKWKEGEDGNGPQEQHTLSDAANSFTDAGLDAPGVATKKKPNKRSYSEGCGIETHELWACRALALGCGNHLRDLRYCWEDANLAQAIKNSDGVTYASSGSGTSENSCRDIQLSMSKCVNRNAAELAERVQSMKKKE